MLLSRGFWERFIKHSPPEYQSERCLRLQITACKICIDCCPHNALGVSRHSKPPNLDPNRCEGCLLCIEACPTGAFMHPESVLNSWTTGLTIKERPLTMVCGQVYKYKQAWVPCGGSLTYPVMTYLAVLGEGLNIHVADCGNCRWKCGSTALQKNAARANQTLSLLVENVHVKICRTLDNSDSMVKSDRNLGRRDFLEEQVVRIKDLCSTTAVVIANSLTSILNTIEVGKIEVAARQWFLEKLQQNPRILPSYLIPFTVLQKRVIGEQEALRAEQRCVTGALNLVRTEGHRKLIYRPECCTKCVSGSCPAWPQAPRDMLANETTNKIVLANWKTLMCPKCNLEYETDSELCPKCMQKTLIVVDEENIETGD